MGAERPSENQLDLGTHSGQAMKIQRRGILWWQASCWWYRCMYQTLYFTSGVLWAHWVTCDFQEGNAFSHCGVELRERKDGSLNAAEDFPGNLWDSIHVVNATPEKVWGCFQTTFPLRMQKWLWAHGRACAEQGLPGISCMLSIHVCSM